MRWLFAAVARRVRAALLADAAGWLEARLLVRAAALRTALLAAADRHDEAGRKEVAADLRRRAGELSGDRPLAGVRAALADLAADRPAAGDVTPPALPGRKAGKKWR